MPNASTDKGEINENMSRKKNNVKIQSHEYPPLPYGTIPKRKRLEGHPDQVEAFGTVRVVLK
jgi:hypothetical protein